MEGEEGVKVIIYEREKMLRAGELLNTIKVSGADNFVALGELVNIINSGIEGEYTEKGGKENGMERQEVCTD